ncbi:MAG TPA: PEP-CTERM sorting domain-containing protein [Syntrophales bacterium]|nr:PEP-CTERM sorting domain-containing protein [Syntrophales bacterium]
MKKRLLFSLLVVSFLVIPYSAGAYTIDDTGDAAYWGGTVQNASPTYYGDIIGGGFNVDSLTAQVTGDRIIITLTGDYFSNYQNSSHMASQYGPGDLYISTSGWNVSGSAPHFTTDTFSLDEGWDYVLSLTDGKIYTLTDDYTETSYGGTGTERAHWGYRSDQAWRGGYGDEICDVEVTLEGDTLTFSFYSSDFLGDLDLNQIGYHWTMLCGNDIVEGGGTPAIPEPSTTILLGLGLLTLGFIKKRGLAR